MWVATRLGVTSLRKMARILKGIYARCSYKSHVARRQSGQNASTVIAIQFVLQRCTNQFQNQIKSKPTNHPQLSKMQQEFLCAQVLRHEVIWVLGAWDLHQR